MALICLSVACSGGAPVRLAASGLAPGQSLADYARKHPGTGSFICADSPTGVAEARRVREEARAFEEEERFAQQSRLDAAKRELAYLKEREREREARARAQSEDAGPSLRLPRRLTKNGRPHRGRSASRSK